MSETLTFEQAYAVTDTIGDVRSFSKNEARRYWDLLIQLPNDAVIVEIGLQWGRSSSLVAQASAWRSRRLHIGIDPFIDPPEAKESWLDLMDKFGHIYALWDIRSDDSKLAVRWIRDYPTVNIALIDGDHWPAGVENDIHLLAPLIKPGGYLLFHDYGVGLPNVYPSVEPTFVRSLMPAGWVEEEPADTLGVWRKL